MKTKLLQSIKISFVIFMTLCSIQLFGQSIPTGDTLKVNFLSKPTLPTTLSQVNPTGYETDFGELTASHSTSLGNFTYGWSADLQGQARQRIKSTDVKCSLINFNASGITHKWTVYLTPGKYSITIILGDTQNIDSSNYLRLMDNTLILDPTPAKDTITGSIINPNAPRFDTYNFPITVAADGIFSFRPANSKCNAKVCAIQISNFDLGTTTAVNTNAEVKTVCYLNSTNNQLSVKNNDGVQSIGIYNINGQSLLNKTVNKAESTLNVSNLSNGLYVVKVILQNGKSEFVKVLKK